jgi:hypothetical protein
MSGQQNGLPAGFEIDNLKFTNERWIALKSGKPQHITDRFLRF